MDMVFGAGKSGHVENASGGWGRLVGGNTGEMGAKESWGVGGSVEGARRAPGRRRRGKTQRVEEESSGGIWRKQVASFYWSDGRWNGFFVRHPQPKYTAKMVRVTFLLEEGTTSLQPIRSIFLQNGPQRKTPIDVIILGLGPWYGQVGWSIFKCCFVKYMVEIRVPFYIYKLINSLSWLKYLSKWIKILWSH